MMAILVTGCAGFVGAHVTKALIDARRDRVVGIDSLDPYYDPQPQARAARKAVCGKTGSGLSVWT